MTDIPFILEEVNPVEIAGAVDALVSFVLDPDSPRNTVQWRTAACVMRVIDDSNRSLQALNERVLLLESDNHELRSDLYALRAKVGHDEQSAN